MNTPSPYFGSKRSIREAMRKSDSELAVDGAVSAIMHELRCEVPLPSGRAACSGLPLDGCCCGKPPRPMVPLRSVVLGFAAALALGGVATLLVLPASREPSGLPEELQAGSTAPPSTATVAWADIDAAGVCEPVEPAGWARSTAPAILLDAIRDAESLGSDVSKPNAAGALGPYQFLRPTWDDHARGVVWERAVDEPTARVVAARYLGWLDRTITKWQGSPATTEQVLGAWHSGIGTLRNAGFDWQGLGPRGRAFVEKVMAAQ